MSDELAPCPFCEDGGKPYHVVGRQPFFSVTIKCHTCHAEGPHVKFDPNGWTHRMSWNQTIQEPRVEAARLWNKRHGTILLSEEDLDSSQDTPDRLKRVVSG